MRTSTAPACLMSHYGLSSPISAIHVPEDFRDHALSHLTAHSTSVHWAPHTTSSVYTEGADSDINISEDPERPNLSVIEAWAGAMLVRTFLSMRVFVSCCEDHADIITRLLASSPPSGGGTRPSRPTRFEK